MVKDATDRQKQIDDEISTIKSDETMTIQEKSKALDSIDSQKKAVDEEVESLKEAQDEIVPSKKDDAAKPEPRDVNNPDAKTNPEVSKALEGSKMHQEYVEKPRAEQIKEQRPTFNELKKQVNDVERFIQNHTGAFEAAAGQGRICDTPTDTISMSLDDDQSYVTVHGSSMEPVLQDGDVVVVSATNIVRSQEEIMLVKINGDEATLKHVKYTNDGIYLIAENPAVYRAHFYSDKDIEELPVTIEGVVVKLIREL